jgi:hypothetical protein
MMTIEEGHDCRASHAEPVSRAHDPHIGTTVGQGSVKNMDGIFAAPGGRVDFRQIQVQLGFISFHAQGGLAEFQGLIPFPVRPGDANSEKREIVRIRLGSIEGVTEIFKRVTRIAVPHKCQGVFELGDSGGVFHFLLGLWAFVGWGRGSHGINDSVPLRVRKSHI